MIIVKKECCGNKTYANYLWNSWISLTWQDVVGRVSQWRGMWTLLTEHWTLDNGLVSVSAACDRVWSGSVLTPGQVFVMPCVTLVIVMPLAWERHRALVIQSLRALNTEHNAELMPNALISCWLLFWQLGLVLVLSASRCYLQFYLHSAHLICPDTLETTQPETSYLLT